MACWCGVVGLDALPVRACCGVPVTALPSSAGLLLTVCQSPCVRHSCVYLMGEVWVVVAAHSTIPPTHLHAMPACVWCAVGLLASLAYLNIPLRLWLYLQAVGAVGWQWRLLLLYQHAARIMEL